jgi:exo-beta-1,3-glucanase (GH17 family)
MGKKKPHHGFCIGVWDEHHRDDEEFQKKAIRTVAPHTEWVRFHQTYYYSEYLHKLGIKIAANAWIGGDHAINFKDVDDLISQAKKGNVDLAIVGNEMLFRRDCTPEHLIDCLDRFKNAVPQIPVTTGEVEEFWQLNPQIIDHVDIIGMHHYPFWCDIPIERAMKDFDERYRALKAISRGKEIQILETGWPTKGVDKEGRPRGGASLKNAQRYFREFVAWSRANNVKYFWFHAFDEKWKIRDEGTIGQNWGMWTTPDFRRKYK